MEFSRQILIFHRAIAIAAILSGSFGLNAFFATFVMDGSNQLLIAFLMMYSLLGFVAGIMVLCGNLKGLILGTIYFGLQVIYVQIKGATFGFVSGIAFTVGPEVGSSGIGLNVIALPLTILFIAAYQGARDGINAT